MNPVRSGRALALLLVICLPLAAHAQEKRRTKPAPGSRAPASAPRRPAPTPAPAAPARDGVQLVTAQCDCGVRHQTRDEVVVIALDAAGHPVPDPFRAPVCVHNANAVPASDYVVWENRTGFQLIVQFPDQSPLANGARALQLGRGTTRVHLGKVRPAGGRRGEYPYVISRPGDGKRPPMVLKGAALLIGD